MKLTTRGFTLVELMIVISIIGILAAALFPSLTTYLKRSRDAARTSHIKDISTAIGAYYSDREIYPNISSGCIAEETLTSNYMENGVPRDPTTTVVSGCGVQGIYTYGSGTSTLSAPQFAIGGYFENTNGGNTASGLSTISGAFSAAERDGFDAYAVSKGAGSGYVLYK